MSKSRFREYLSMESIEDSVVSVETEEDEYVEIEIPPVTDVTEEEEEAADEIIDDASKAYAEQSAELADSEEIIATAQDEIATLESLKEIAEFGLESQRYSPQFAAVLAKSMERYGELFGEETPSLEDYGKDNLEAYYQVSVESASGFIARLLRTPQRAINRMFEKSIHWDEVAKSQTESYQKKADALLNDLAGVPNGSVKLSARDSKLLNGASSLGAAIKAAQDAGKALGLTYMAKAKKYEETILDGLKKITKHPEMDYSSITAQAANLAHPNASIPSNLLKEGALPLGAHVVAETPNVSGNTTEKLKALSKVKLPVIEYGKAKTAEDKTASKADLVAAAKAIKVNTALIAAISKATRDAVPRVIHDDELADRRQAVGRTAARAKSWEAAKEADHLSSLMVRATYLPLQARIEACDYLTMVNHALISIVSKGIKELKKSAKDSE